MQNVLERFGKFGLGIIKAVDTPSKKIIGRSIQSESKKQWSNIDNPPAAIVLRKSRNQLFNVLFEDLSVDKSLLCKHWPNQVPGSRPELAVSRKNAVSQKIFPLPVEAPSLSVITELTGQNSLDVLWISSKDIARIRTNFKLGCRNITAAL